MDFETFISPLEVKHFRYEIFEQGYHHARRPWFDTSRICTKDDVFRVAQDLYDRRHDVVRDVASSQRSMGLDVTRYEDGRRLDVEWKSFSETERDIVEYCRRTGSSFRLLQPQYDLPGVFAICEAMEEVFGTNAGCNIYYTPSKDCQGFSPHYDDVNVIVVQLMGRKKWKVREREECFLWNESSIDSQDPYVQAYRDGDKKNAIEITLEEGDLLYLPRGVIHEARTDHESDSLHCTFSTGYRSSVYDYLEIVMKKALEKLRREDMNCRRAMPSTYMRFMGTFHRELMEGCPSPGNAQAGDPKVTNMDTYIDKCREKREEFRRFVRPSLKKWMRSCHEVLDESIDEFGIEALQHYLPGTLTTKDGGNRGTTREVSVMNWIRVHRLDRYRLVMGVGDDDDNDDDDKSIIIYQPMITSDGHDPGSKTRGIVFDRSCRELIGDIFHTEQERLVIDIVKKHSDIDRGFILDFLQDLVDEQVLIVTK